MVVLAITIKEKSLDTALDSFDDQYQDCDPAMEEALPALGRSEFHKNHLFAQVWAKAFAEWQKAGSPVSPLSSRAQAIAIMTYTMNDLYTQFNDQVRVAGRSPQEYRDNFHFKTLHFLLTKAVATLRAAQGEQCRCVFIGVNKYKFKANRSNIVRFGQYASSSLCENVSKNFGSTTVFKVQTCHGVEIQEFSKFPSEKEVLIPPFEKFKVTYVNDTEDGKRNVEIHLDSIGTYSKYNCEWLRGGSIPRTPPGHHNPGSGHRDPLSHETTKDTQVSMVTMATTATMAT
ncbi:erythroblast NAD(P)(+)--arginine ADP-ribosyltransferase-like [Catharus ustulatus]|uniref:erythroblast NAD(P)(+)--arginine ADP-ribosyltransferase-like n=1 Tax=Catharus ustulatus TaxID=91951 RepID=UPI00140DC39D|nr:erythroblast NAD(P)(+)--arginine ADP-ribosyltransferase-like [Catharus ustulatus]